MKTSIRKYLLAVFVIVFFAGNGLLPLFSDSKTVNNWYALQKDKTEKESGQTGSSDENNQKEFLSENNRLIIPEWNLFSGIQKYFISNSSINNDCFISVITPPPEQI